MKLVLNEQEIVDATCEYMSKKYSIDPISVDVDEMDFNEQEKFFAEVSHKEKSYDLDEQTMANAIKDFLYKHYNFIPDLLKVKFDYKDERGFSAKVNVNDDE